MTPFAQAVEIHAPATLRLPKLPRRFQKSDEKIMNDDFSGWTKADFARWLHENYPKPLNLLEDTSWIVELRIHHSSKKKDIFELTARGDYETCMNDLAKELAFYAHAGLLAKERWEIFIHPAPRK